MSISRKYFDGVGLKRLNALLSGAGELSPDCAPMPAARLAVAARQHRAGAIPAAWTAGNFGKKMTRIFTRGRVRNDSLVNFLNPALMPAAFKRRVEPGLHDLQGGDQVHHPFAQRNDVRIIMQPREARRVHVPADGAAHPLDAVRDDG